MAVVNSNYSTGGDCLSILTTLICETEKTVLTLKYWRRSLSTILNEKKLRSWHKSKNSLHAHVYTLIILNTRSLQHSNKNISMSAHE